jgi:3-oxoacyl-[acyl-carrier-protein] synthase II
MARVSQLASSAAIEAVKDAGLDLDNEDKARIGCVIGSAAGDFEHLEDQHIRFLKMGPGSINPMTVPRVIPNMPVCNAAMVLGIHGPNLGSLQPVPQALISIGIALDFSRRWHGRCYTGRWASHHDRHCS